MAGIGVIINVNAAGNRRRPRRAHRFRDIVGAEGFVEATRDLRELEAALKDFKQREIDILAVCGGDGSFFHAVSRTIEIWGADSMPLLLPLRAGTINNLSRSIGARRKRAESMLAHVVKDYRYGRTHEITERELICVNGEYYGYIIGAALVTNFLKLYYSGRKPGPLSAFGLLVMLFFSNLFGTSLIKAVVPTVAADIVCDGERVPFRGFTLILASSVAYIGLGVKPFYLSGRKRGYFHLLAGCSRPGRLLARLWRFFRGFPSGLPSMYDNMAQHVSIEFEQAQAFTINGEIMDAVKRLELEPGPRVSFISG